ncbi:hypothetical protein CALVIDRAFT_46347 [Calocera viscosa TUFC12733]|uniref:Aminoglycoside phosphotransferase domain-containing protein n=1 Tax=Calocera viscosa (strain TUFC12733) TaxID=1330018 RepID=A0A167FLG6_CALVF|nr:hypothetical protein CALVIDRAFT_46347 [Calocera viscosa TUFC12733]
MIPTAIPLAPAPVPVWRISRSMVLKASDGNVDALSCVFIQQNTTIAVPDVWLAFQDTTGSYMISQYIESAATLESAWPTLDEETKGNVIGQLSDYVKQLRQLEGRPAHPDPVLPVPSTGPCFGLCEPGPFESLQELFDFFDHKRHVFNKLGGNVNPYQFPDETRLVFVHQDLNPRNLLVDKDERLWIIDWKNSGFYPECFEYCAVFLQAGDGVYQNLEDLAQRELDVIGNQHESFGRLVRSIRWVLTNASQL